MKKTILAFAFAIIALTGFSAQTPVAGAVDDLIEETAPLAAPEKTTKRFSIQAENDFWFHKDCDYTHGTRLAYEWGPWTFAVQQNMYTPNNKKADYPLPDQHPYAGYLVGEAGYLFQHKNSSDYLGLQLGLIGPHTYAEQTQKFIHKLIGDVEPMGWDYQLKDEFVFQVNYIHRQSFLLFGERNGWNTTFIAKGGGSAGLAQDYGMLGAELRFGYNPYRGTDDDIFIVAAVRDNVDWSLYGIVSGEFRAYAWNAFLDGNYHRESMSVDSKWDVWEGRFGFGFDIFDLDGRVVWVYRSKEYDTQLKNTQFMSVELGWTF